MHPATRAAWETLDDLIRDPQADSLVLRIFGLGLAAGLVLMAAGVVLARKVGV